MESNNAVSVLKEREMFALAVAGQYSKLRVYRNNAKIELRWSLEAMNLPFMVYITTERDSFRTLAFDFDAKKITAEEVENEVAKFSSELDELQIRYVVCESGPSGGRHVFVCFANDLDDLSVRNLAYGIEARFQSFDKTNLLNSKTGAIRPPLALHRNGGSSTILGVSKSEALAILYDRNPIHLFDPLARKFPTPSEPPSRITGLRKAKRMTQRALQLLYRGDHAGRFASRSELTHSIVCSAIRAGMSAEALFIILMNPANEGGEKVRELASNHGRHRALKYLEREFREAAKFLQKNPMAIHEGGLDCTYLDVGASLVFEPSKTVTQSSTTRLVIAAHLKIAWQVGSPTYTASDRQISEISGVSRRSVGVIHRKLIEQGLLERIEIGKFEHGSQWELLPKLCAEEKRSTPHLSVENQSDPTTPLHLLNLFDLIGTDLFCRTRAGFAWALIVARTDFEIPTKFETLTRTLGTKERSANNVIRQALSLGLISQVERSFFRSKCDFDEIAVRLGLSGAAVRARAEHTNDRERHLESCDRVAEQDQIRRLSGWRQLGQNRRTQESALDSRPTSNSSQS